MTLWTRPWLVSRGLTLAAQVTVSYHPALVPPDRLIISQSARPGDMLVLPRVLNSRERGKAGVETVDHS